MLNETGMGLADEYAFQQDDADPGQDDVVINPGIICVATAAA